MKIVAEVKVNRIHSYSAPSYNPYDGYETHYIYDMTSIEDGKNYVWKTTKVMRIHNRNYDCCCRPENTIYPGDVIRITGNFKANVEYKGNPQVLISRVEVVERMFAEMSPSEKIDAQLASVTPFDKLIEMSYKEYKNKFADCETILNSYNQYNKTIVVIVRDYDNRKVA